MYFQLINDVMVKHGIHEPLGLPWDLNFMQGSVIQEPVDNPFIFRTKAEVGDKLPDFSDGGFPAMSGRFVKTLEGAGVDNLEKFPVLVKSEVDGTVWDGYYLVNILGTIKCADLERSTYTETFSGNFNFKELAIDAEKAKDALLFRLQESPSTILIHKSVGKHIGRMDPNRELTGWAAKKIIQ